MALFDVWPPKGYFSIHLIPGKNVNWYQIDTTRKLLKNKIQTRFSSGRINHLFTYFNGFKYELLGAYINPIAGGRGGGWIALALWFFWSVPKTVCASAMKFGDFSYLSIGRIVPKFWLPTLRRGGSRDIFVEVLFAELRVFRHFPPISALLRLAIATDDIHRHLYAFTTTYVMSHVTW